MAQHPKGEWVIATIQQNDAIVDVISANFYRPWNVTKDTLPIVHERIDLYDTDGVHEPVHLGEWGHYNSRGYESVSGALKWGEDLIWQSNCFDYPNSKGDISSIFSLYNWDGMQGIIAGIPPATPVKTETYYAFRTIIRGLQGGRPMYGQIENYGSQVVNTKAPDGTLYVLFQGGKTATTISLDVSAHVSSGTATFYEYSANHKDEIIGTAGFTGGILNFTVAKNSFTLVAIPT